MTEESLKKANELTEEIKRLEDFMYWASDLRKENRKYPALLCFFIGTFGAINIFFKRSWFAGERKEYKISKRLQERVCQCVEEELDLLKAERDEL